MGMDQPTASVELEWAFSNFAQIIAARNHESLLNDGPEEQIERAVQALKRFHATTPLSPVSNTVIDLAGFGEAPVHFASDGDRYLLLSEVAQHLGMPAWKACDWARQQRLWAVEDQRTADEERGDGRLGWDCLRDYVDLRFDFIADDPQATPDVNGKRWSTYGDWLLSATRLPLFIMVSPWGKEFTDNIAPHMGHAMRKAFGDKLKDIPTYDAVDGEPTGRSAHDSLYGVHGLTEDEALRRARRGPVIEPHDDL